MLALPLLVALSAPAAQGQFDMEQTGYALSTPPGRLAATAPSTADDLVANYNIYSFAPASSSLTYDRIGVAGASFGVSLDGPSGSGLMVRSLNLPSGAMVTGIEFEGCDDSDTSGVATALWNCPSPGGDCALVTAFSTGTSETPGCDFFAAAIDPPITLDQRNNRHMLSTSGGPDEGFHAVRVFWRRQVGPAPSFPTFDDVPASHPFFQEIEALAASGIIDGVCSDPNKFCPDGVLTRAQIAALLARALGLHWGNF